MAVVVVIAIAANDDDDDHHDDDDDDDDDDVDVNDDGKGMYYVHVIQTSGLEGQRTRQKNLLTSKSWLT